MKNLLAKITKTVTHPTTTGVSPVPIIYLIALIAIWWGVILIVVPEPVSYMFAFLLRTHLARIGLTTNISGLLFLLLGFGKLLAIATNKRRLIKHLLWLSTGVWTFLTAFLAVSNAVTVIFGTYFIITMATIWAYWRVEYERSINTYIS